MANAIFVTQFAPSDVGHGGDHRAYQIWHDLELAVGKERVVVISLPQWRQQTAHDLGDKLLRRLVLYGRRGNSLPRRLARTLLITRQYSSPGLLAHYQRVVEQLASPALCVIQDVGFAGLLTANRLRGLPTLSCPDNLESLDTAWLDHGQRWPIQLAMAGLAGELGVLAQCDERLFISRVETGLVGGLGLPSRYYPYLPVGGMRQRLLEVRRRRSSAEWERGLFVMLGSAVHTTTRASFAWFVRQAHSLGLPEGARVVVAGKGTDALLPPGARVPGLELRGWLEPNDLDALLVLAQAVLAPQRSGFGALTRLPEMACAGVPVMASRHATYALDPTPGLVAVEDEWAEWCTAMKDVVREDAGFPAEAYAVWEERQPKSLETLVRAVLYE